MTPKKANTLLALPNLFLLVAVTLIFSANRLAITSNPALPATPAGNDLYSTCRSMQKADRNAIGALYKILAKSVEGDSATNPVLYSTSQLRAANRAGLLFVWKGELGNPENKYPNLRAGLEKEFTSVIGLEDLPLNPELRGKAVALFNKIGQACE